MRLPFRVHNFRPSQKARRPSYFSLIHQPVGSMDGFQTLARRRGGVCFSAAGVKAAGSLCFAERLLVRRPAAQASTTVLYEGGTFIPMSVGDSNWDCQVQRCEDEYGWSR